MTMSLLDVFAWIVLIILVASTAAVIVFLAMLPGMIAKRRAAATARYSQLCQSVLTVPHVPDSNRHRGFG